jgi:hypothetical protein
MLLAIGEEFCFCFCFFQETGPNKEEMAKDKKQIG